MEIRNEVKPSGKEVEKKKFVVRNAADVQRAKLEKLMKNPDKPVVIPAPARNRDFSNAIPSFVRNVMGSSAGAGSGEFHVYRHLRRKEYARQKQIQEKSRSELLDDAFQDKLEQNRKAAEERTSKKRAKRLKKKAKQKAHGGKKPKLTKTEEEPSSSSSPSESDDAPDEAQVDTAGEGAQISCTDGKDSAEQDNVANHTSKDDDEPKDENVGSTSKPVVSSNDDKEDQSNSKEEQSADTDKSEQDEHDKSEQDEGTSNENESN